MSIYISEKNIVLCGFMGCGKTTVGKHLASLTGRKFIDIDACIEEKTALTINEIFNKYGETRFRDIETACVYEMSEKTGCVIATGGGTILNDENVKVLKKSGQIFFLNLSFDVMFRRISHEAKRPLVKQLNKLALEKLFEERLEKYQACADVIIDASKSCASICADILECPI